MRHLKDCCGGCAKAGAANMNKLLEVLRIASYHLDGGNPPSRRHYFTNCVVNVIVIQTLLPQAGKF